MKNQLTPFRNFRRPVLNSWMRIAAVVALLALIGIPLFSSSSASSKGEARIGESAGVSRTLLSHDSNKQQSLVQEYMRKARVSSSVFELPHAGIGRVSPPSSFLLQALAPEGIATYAVVAGACTSTPQISFVLGDQVCARIVNAPAGERRINWIGASGFIASSEDLITEENIFTLPLGSASRGLWFVGDVSSSDGALYAAAAFAVRDPVNPSTDLAVNMANSFEASPGGNLSFILQVANNGPDTAHNLVLTNLSPVGTSFLGITQEPGGPVFSCDPGAGFTCTAESLARGDVASFTIIYQVAAGTPDGTLISNIVEISSSTTELKPSDNSVLSDAKVSATAASESCTLDCPSDIVTTANTTQSGASGALVTFGAGQGFGNCGSISNNPASGSFFAVGLHTITSTSSEGPTCTFTVNVLDSAAPTISCPPDRTVTAPEGSDEATVDPGTPISTPSTGVVTGERSDSTPAVVDEQGNVITPAISVPLTDPYPVGTTGITWTVADAAGRRATCQQKIIVNGTACGSDTQPPTITAPADLTVFTGSDNTGCSLGLDDELGQAEAEDNCTVTVSVSGIPANSAFPIGSTTLTYTATDGVGQTATDTQVVTVVDNTPPSIAAPPDASYACLSEVPAASPAQATRGTVLDENGDPLPPGPPFDNCGTPEVTVSETSDGTGSAASPRIITRTFTATDGAGNTASASQTITVIDDIAPTVSAPADASYQCASLVPTADADDATASDNCAAPALTVSDSSNGGAGSAASPLVITRTFTATDAAGNTASASQTITVIDATAPVITVDGANPQVVECHTSYSELGATANDNCGGDSPATPSGSVDADTPGTYTITYNATDAAGNVATPVTRTVTVVDTTAPVITLSGSASVTVECHTSYTDAGANAADSCDSSVAVTPSGLVDVNTVGTYTLTYNASDDSGNAATPVVRTVNVVDTTAPTIGFNSLTLFFNNWTFVFNANTVTVNGQVYPYNGVSFTHGDNTFSFNGETITINGNEYTLEGKTLVLWTPTHQYQEVKVNDLIQTAGDGCDSGLSRNNVVISQVTSDEPANTAGSDDGHTLTDIVISPDCKSVQLRAERAGSGNGRFYTITSKVTDASGNTTTVTSTVRVRRYPFQAAVDSGPQYTILGNCP